MLSQHKTTEEVGVVQEASIQREKRGRPGPVRKKKAARKMPTAQESAVSQTQKALQKLKERPSDGTPLGSRQLEGKLCGTRKIDRSFGLPERKTTRKNVAILEMGGIEGR